MNLPVHEQAAGNGYTWAAVPLTVAPPEPSSKTVAPKGSPVAPAALTQPVPPSQVTWRDLAAIFTRQSSGVLRAVDLSTARGATAESIDTGADDPPQQLQLAPTTAIEEPMHVDSVGSETSTSVPAAMSEALGARSAIGHGNTNRGRMVASDAAIPETQVEPGEWLLRFDGACRGNPGPGGAGAALFSPSGAIVCSCAQYLPGSRTNNFAEYAGILAGVSSAVHHGISHLRIEGDSTLVIEQVVGHWRCRSHSLLCMRRRVRDQLSRLSKYSLTHIDRLKNRTADGLPNQGLNGKRTSTACSHHSGSDLADCWSPGCAVAAAATEAEPHATGTQAASQPPVDQPLLDLAAAKEQADIACRDGGEVFPVMNIDDGAEPARRPILRLRPLDTAELEEAETAVEAVASTLAVKIADSADWEIAEGYITAMSYRIYDALLAFSDQARDRAAVSGRSLRDTRQRRPVDVGATSSNHRLEEALHRLREVQRSAPEDRAAIKRARRKVGLRFGDRSNVRSSTATRKLVWSGSSSQLLATLLTGQAQRMKTPQLRPRQPVLRLDAPFHGPSWRLTFEA
jgi:ribonuclease HI